MSAIDEFKNIFSDLPEEERLPAALDALLQGVKEGIFKAVRDPDGDVRYIHTGHYNGEPLLSIEEVAQRHQVLLYGEGLN